MFSYMPQRYETLPPIIIGYAIITPRQMLDSATRVATGSGSTVWYSPAAPATLRHTLRCRREGRHADDIASWLR